MDEVVTARVRARLQRIAAGDSPAPGELLDLRELEAPQPLEQALLRASSLCPGESFAAWTPRVPRMLLQRLQERGFEFVVEVAPDGTALTFITRPVDAPV